MRRAVAIIGSVALVAVGGYLFLDYLQKHAEAAYEAKRRELRQTTVDAMREEPGVAAIWDAETLAMLIGDPKCVANVNGAYLSMNDYSDPRLRNIVRLINIREISFYGGGDVEGLLQAARKLPSVEELYFEQTLIDDETVDSLADWPSLKTVVFWGINDTVHVERLSKLMPQARVLTGDQYHYPDNAEAAAD